jgi:hypothetical protein
VSGQAAGLDIDLVSALDPESTGDSGVPHGAELLAFANAVQIDQPSLNRTRDVVESLVGTDGMLEAAATIAIFNGLVRVADGTGIQLDDGVVMASADYREELGVNAFAGGVNTLTEGPRPMPSTDHEITSIRDLFA